MKKIVLSAAFAMAASLGAQAQTVDGGNNINVTLNLQNIITLTPNSQGGVATFNSLNDYSNGQSLSENPLVAPGGGLGEFEFTIGASREYKVEVNAGAATFTPSGGGEAGMPCSVLRMRLRTWPTGSSPVAAYTAGPNGAALTTSATTFLTHPTGHNLQDFSLDLFANPGYGWDGGTYSLPVVFTASLD